MSQSDKLDNVCTLKNEDCALCGLGMRLCDLGMGLSDGDGTC